MVNIVLPPETHYTRTTMFTIALICSFAMGNPLHEDFPDVKIPTGHGVHHKRG